MDKFEVGKTTRKIAAQSLAKALQTLLKESEPISEINLRDAWLKELRTHKTIFPNGWYTPPTSRYVNNIFIRR